MRLFNCAGAIHGGARVSRVVDVVFQPIVHGMNTARLVLNHTPTPMGTQTAIEVSGMGLAPSLKVSKSALHFGKCPPASG